MNRRDEIAERLRATFARLPMEAGKEAELEVAIDRLLSLIADAPSAGPAPAMFRDVAYTTAISEVNTLARRASKIATLAKRCGKTTPRLAAALLAKTLKRLCKTSILALAETHSAPDLRIPRKARMFGAERLALQELADRVASGGDGPSDAERELLSHAVAAATEAKLELEFLARIARYENQADDKTDHHRSRPAKNRSAAIARILKKDFETLTGRQPTVTVNVYREKATAEGYSLDLITDVFDILGVPANAEWAGKKARKATDGPAKKIDFPPLYVPLPDR